MARLKKEEAESAIRQIIGIWIDELRVSPEEKTKLSFHSFKNWAGEKGYGHYFDFRSSISPIYDAELWFDEETNQVWKR